MIKIRFQPEKMIPVDELVPHPKNRNAHPKDQIERLADILKAQGWRYPIKVSNQSGFITSGHGRLEAAKLLRMKEVPVSFQDYEDEALEYADLVADNAIASWSELDFSGINSDIGDLGPDFNIDLLGIKNFKIDVAEKELGDPDYIPEKAETRVKKGEVWILGDHRLMCGDSTMVDDIGKLMGEDRADLWLTDPPYGVGYQSNGAEDKHDKIENDDLPLEKMAEFWEIVASNAYLYSKDKSAYYWFACQGGDQMMMMMCIGRAKWKVRHELIWVKDSLVMGRCDYHYKHEPILYGWKINGTHKWMSDRKQTSVLEFPRPKSSKEHPTMKPVDLVKYLMCNNTESGDVVLDTFGGSGTTLIAAEASNRRARLVELSEKYCDVIVARWEKYTGKTAVLA